MLSDVTAQTSLSSTEIVRACPCCGSSSRDCILEDAQDLITSSTPPGFFGIWKCLTCSSTYLSPRPTSEHLALYYPEDEYYPLAERRVSSSHRWAATVKQHLRFLLSLPYSVRFGRAESTVAPFGQCRMLEIGFGHGIYLREMHRLGWEVYGCDISRHKVEQLKRELGGDHVFLGRIEDISLAPESFDLIVLWHVIEHLHEPRLMLDRIRGLLRPGGRLMIGTPNVHSIEARILRRWWIGFEVPRHLIVFSQKALVQLLVDQGFEVARVRPSLWSYSVPDSLALYLKHRFGFQIWAGRRHRWMHNMLYPWVALSRTLGNWAILEVTAVKPRGNEHSEHFSR